MVAVQNLKGEMIQLILSRKGGGGACTLQVQLLLSSLLNVYETLHSCSTQPADVHEGISLLSKIPKFEHHSIASGGYHSVRSLTVLAYYKLSYYKNLILNLLSGNLVIKLMKHKCGEIIYKDNRN